jgi:hypothetical protein
MRMKGGLIEILGSAIGRKKDRPRRSWHESLDEAVDVRALTDDDAVDRDARKLGVARWRSVV